MIPLTMAMPHLPGGVVRPVRGGGYAQRHSKNPMFMRVGTGGTAKPAIFRSCQGERNNADLCPSPFASLATFCSKSCAFAELLSAGPLPLRFLSLLDHQPSTHPPSTRK